MLLSGDETEGQFGMFVATCPVGDIIPAHKHADTHETFLLLEGKVRVFVETEDGEKTSRLLLLGDSGFVPASLMHPAARTDTGPTAAAQHRPAPDVRGHQRSQAGLAVASIAYRLSGEAQWPARP